MGDETNVVKPPSPEQSLFAEALQRNTPEARAAYLEGACAADPALLHRVEALLRAAESAGDFLENPLPGLADEAWTGEAQFAEKPGDKIGRYKLLEKIGEGGCGVVYMAEQEEPVRRRVALKILKLGMDTRSVVGRFEAERQALALMDHPNIARVFDGGATQTGRPYFVMELVRGVRITEFCDEARLSTEARLRLFVQVCQAIEHAHQKGIIHRDLKPSNILVTVNDGVAVPKVIDFGIAKATGQRLTDKTVFTQFHSFMGTPAYTSPEQAEMSSVDVDTRSDIYSLGVLLYELLTGRTPFDGEELARSGLDEMRRVIREEEPPPPSNRLHSLGLAESTVLSRKRQRSIPELARDVRGDLDCIVMKCLEKDRARRYGTANGLAADIERHLDDLPIQARPVSSLGRFWRWRRRHPAIAVLSASVLLLLIVVAVGSTVSAWRVASARRAEHAERQKAEAANRDLRGANRRLADTVSLLELQRAEDLFEANDSPAAVARLAAMLRLDPSNHIAASRLVSALVHRNWALPAAPPMRHLGRVVSAAFSPDGRHVLSASWDKTAKIWDASSGNEVATLQHRDQVLCARYSPDGALVLTACADGEARIWNATNGVRIISFDHRPRKVWWAELSPDGESVVTACDADNTARIWNRASGALKQELNHGSEVVLARFSPNGEQVVTGTQSGTIRLWNTASGQVLFRLHGHRGRINALMFSPDGTTLLSSSADNTARLWNATNGEPLGAPMLHSGYVNHAAFSPDGRVLLTCSEDNSARLWNTTNGYPIGPPLAHEGGVLFGAFSPDGQMVVTTSYDNSARLWDVRRGTALCQPLRQYEAILHAGFSPDGRSLVTASWDQTVQVWNVQPHRYLGLGMPHEQRVSGVAFDPRGESVLSSSFDHAARLWNARTGQALAEPMHHQRAVLCIDYSRDGQRIVTASEDGTACVWDSKTGKLISGPLQHAKAVWSANLSPDGQRVATASSDGTARIWDVQTGKPVTPPLEHGAVVNGARFSPDGRLIVTASQNGSARVWNAQTGQPVTEPLQHIDHVEWADFSPDGQRVVSASSDNTARIWDARTGKPICPPLQHPRTVPKAVFSPDGGRVATSSLDRTVRVWDARTGEALTPPLTHKAAVSQVCFSPDGRQILTACWNSNARLWDANTGRPLTEWLPAGGRRFQVCFDSTGRRIAGADGRMLRIWDTPSVPTPVPPWFPGLAEAVGGMRLSSRGNTELVSRHEIADASRRLASVSSGNFYERLSRWFLADPSQRSVSPF